MLLSHLQPSFPPSSWTSPVRKICNETAWISLDTLNARDCANPGRICLRVLFELTPFTVTVEDGPPNGWVDFGAAADMYQSGIGYANFQNFNPELAD